MSTNKMTKSNKDTKEEKIKLATNDQNALKLAEKLKKLADTTFNQGQFENAAQYYNQAISLKPTAVLYSNLGSTYMHLKKINQAIDVYKKAIDLDPNYFPPYQFLGGALIQSNKKKLAEEYLRKGLKLNPSAAEAIRNLSNCVTYNDSNHQDAKLILNLLHDKEKKLSTFDEIHLRYALAKIYDDAKDYDKAFLEISTANKLKVKSEPYDINKFENLINRIIETFNEDFFKKFELSAFTTKAPVFIVGAPCSGKTLIESTIAMHPDISAADELETLTSIISNLPKIKNTNHQFPEVVSELDDSTICLIFVQYITRLFRDADKNVKRITDTMPKNLLFLGLISKIMPNAKFIIVNRNKGDLYLSQYFKYFVNVHSYSYDLATIKKHDLAFDRLIKHWNKNFPDKILNVQYDDFVNDPKKITAKIIEHLDLEFSDKIKFDKINSSYINKSKFYNKYLNEFLKF